MMAIVSKAVFESEAGKSPTAGTVLGMDRYTSLNKNLQALAEGGKLYLVTVRPPDETLWLVAILEQPKFNKKAWIAKPSTVAITAIGALRKKLKFESGKGITAAKGALGMSLQTPRALTAEDCALLDAAAQGAGKAAGKADKTAKAEKPGKFDKTLPPAKSGIAPAGAAKDALLAAVIADPKNLDARRVYADQLAMHNDPRGEFILVELALSGRLSIRKRILLNQRADELRKKYGKQWWPYKGQLRMHAGFVEAIAGDFKAVNAAAPKLLEAEPASVVTIQIAKDEIDKLAKATWAGNVRRLTLRGTLGDEAFAELVAIPRLANLTSLNVTNTGLGKGFALGEHLVHLTSLVLTANALGPLGLAALCKWKGLATVERLFLSDCGLVNKDVANLLAAKLPRVQKLTLSRNAKLDDELGDILAGHARNLPALTHLELVGTSLDAAGVDAIRKAKFARLARIDVRNTDVEAADDPRVRFDEP
ncbi:MAG: TIGR02996 domain-containing protein [Proteobacteria bacterium]|nr:TIGR02996 domain-containing protein [Pseudomonadota bacterium]